MWQRRIQTNFKLWAASSIAMFIAAGCVNWVPEGKTAPYWGWWALFLSGEYGCTNTDFAFHLALGGATLAVPSAILGWAAQAVVSVAVALFRDRLGTRKP